jgi:hypothetical protein
MCTLHWSTSKTQESSTPTSCITKIRKSVKETVLKTNPDFDLQVAKDEHHRN